MAHKPVTHSPLPMPHVPGLLRYPNGRYRLNVRVPIDLKSCYPSGAVRRSLYTSDYKVAKSRLLLERLKVDDEFKEKRRKLNLSPDGAAFPRRKLEDLSEREYHALIFRWLIEMEKQNESWWDTTGRFLDQDESKEALENLGMDELAYSGGSRSIQPADLDDVLMFLLDEERIDFEKPIQPPRGRRRVAGPDGRTVAVPLPPAVTNGSAQVSPAFRKLSALLQRAMVESIRRSTDRVERKPVQVREDLFQNVFAHTVLPGPKSSVTLGELLRRHEERTDERIAKFELAPGTKRSYTIPYRILLEKFGAAYPLEKLRKGDFGQLYLWMEKIPANATQRYRGLTLQQAIAMADREKNFHRLGSKTIDNYVTNVTAIFSFAAGTELMLTNPASSKHIRPPRDEDEEDDKRPPFEVSQLNSIFNAPLYVGCADDERGCFRPGNFRERRVRFWAPLLALFHGFRLNEIVQLYTEDVGKTGDVHFIHIRKKRADGSKSDKRVKTRQSNRKVPIHPELIRLGFLKFVAFRRDDPAHPRLFPEIEAGPTGYYSARVSKWFSRFKKAAIGEDCEPVFHSFRHNFRDALRNANVSPQDADWLGGWELKGKSAGDGYGDGASLEYFQKVIKKVKYSGLDLSHLTDDFCNRLHPQTSARIQKRRMGRIAQ